MSIYYSAIIYLCWASLAVLCLRVHENARLEHRDKQLMYLTFSLIDRKMRGLYSHADGRRCPGLSAEAG